MTAEKIQLAYENFATGFLHPVLTGTRVRLGSPIAPGMLENFALSRSADIAVDQEIYDRLHWSAGEIAPIRALPWPSRGLMALASACHNLAYVTDPTLDRVFSRGARTKVLEYVDWFISQIGPPSTRGEALSRHAFLERFLALRRIDTTASNWGFTHSYLGRPMPDGAFTKPRWVQVSKKEPSLSELLESVLPGDGPGRLEGIVTRSPVTEFLHTHSFGSFRFGAANLAVLSDDLVRHGIARALVQQGERIQVHFGNALKTLFDRKPPPSLLYYPIALIYEAQVIACLDESSKMVFGSGSEPGAALFAAILPALVGAPDDLGAVLELDPTDLATIRTRAGVLDQQIPSEILKLAVAIIDEATPPPLDHEQTRRPATPALNNGQLAASEEHL